MAACMLDPRAADAHVLGGGKVYQSKAVVVCQLVDAESSDRWFIHLFLSDLSIKASDDDLHVLGSGRIPFPVAYKRPHFRHWYGLCTG